MVAEQGSGSEPGLKGGNPWPVACCQWSVVGRHLGVAYLESATAGKQSCVMSTNHKQLATDRCSLAPDPSVLFGVP